MSLQKQIKEGIKVAMKSGDKVRLNVMRSLSAAFTNELVAKGKTPQESLTDEESLNVIRKSSKQHKDSIEQFTKGGREELAEEEKSELAIIEEFLPKLMSKEEVELFVKDKYNDFEPKDSVKKGMFMSVVMKDLKGKADGSLVKEIVDGLFS